MQRPAPMIPKNSQAPPGAKRKPDRPRRSEDSPSRKAARRSPSPSKPLIWYPEDAEAQAQAKFNKQIKESEGFDFDEFPHVNVITVGGVRPVDLDHHFDGVNVKDCVDFVIGQYNDNHLGVSQLLLDGIIKANSALVNGMIYYITFKATDALCSLPKNATKVYQAKVYWQWDGTMKTIIFRVAREKKPIRGMEDRPVTLM